MSHPKIIRNGIIEKTSAKNNYSEWQNADWQDQQNMGRADKDVMRREKEVIREENDVTVGENYVTVGENDVTVVENDVTVGENYVTEGEDDEELTTEEVFATGAILGGAVTASVFVYGVVAVAVIVAAIFVFGAIYMVKANLKKHAAESELKMRWVEYYYYELLKKYSEIFRDEYLIDSGEVETEYETKQKWLEFDRATKALIEEFTELYGDDFLDDLKEYERIAQN